MLISRWAFPIVLAVAPLAAGTNSYPTQNEGVFPLVEPNSTACVSEPVQKTNHLAAEFLGLLWETDAMMQSPSSAHLEHWLTLRGLAESINRQSAKIADRDLQLEADELNGAVADAAAYLGGLDANVKPELGHYANMVEDAEVLAQDILMITESARCGADFSD